MGMVCQICGVSGYSEALVSCSMCKTSIEHQYCIGKGQSLQELEPNWLCEECKPKPLEPEVVLQGSTKKSNDQFKRTNHIRPARNTRKQSRKKKSHPKVDVARRTPFLTGLRLVDKKSSRANVNDIAKIKGVSSGLPPVQVDNFSHSSRKNFEIEKSKKKKKRMISAEKTQLQEDIPHHLSWVEVENISLKSRKEYLLKKSVENRRLMLAEQEQLDVNNILVSRKTNKGHVVHTKKPPFKMPLPNNVIAFESQKIGDNLNRCLRSSIDSHQSVETFAVETCNDSFNSENLRNRRRGLRLPDEDHLDEELQVKLIGKDVKVKSLHSKEYLLSQTVQTDALNKSHEAEPTLKVKTCNAELNMHSKPSNNDDLKKRRRRLILLDEDQLDEEFQVDLIGKDVELESVQVTDCDLTVQANAHEASKSWRSFAVEDADENLCLPAQPIIDYAWRGCFNVCTKEYGPIAAHLSTKACARVQYAAQKMPTMLQMTKLPRLDSWPRSFKTSPPNDYSIALYFFPDDCRTETIVSQLLDDITKRDLLLKVVLDDAELFVFSSIVLPESFQRFQGKYFLWGVFRGRQESVFDLAIKNDHQTNKEHRNDGTLLCKDNSLYAGCTGEESITVTIDNVVVDAGNDLGKESILELTEINDQHLTNDQTTEETEHRKDNTVDLGLTGGIVNQKKTPEEYFAEDWELSQKYDHFNDVYRYMIDMTQACKNTTMPEFLLFGKKISVYEEPSNECSVKKLEDMQEVNYIDFFKEEHQEGMQPDKGADSNHQQQFDFVLDQVDGAANGYLDLFPVGVEGMNMATSVEASNVLNLELKLFHHSSFHDDNGAVIILEADAHLWFNYPHQEKQHLSQVILLDSIRPPQKDH